MSAHPDNPHGTGRYLPVLDGWRAVAILFVMLFHGLHNTALPGSKVLPALQTITGHIGALGVLIFFAISGYIITTRLLAETPDAATLSLRVFFLRRCFRILPALAVYLGVLSLLALAHLIHLQRADWASPLFLSNYFPGSWYTRHFWSLSVEEHFYLFWPLTILVAGWRRSLWIAITLMGLVSVWRAYHLAHLGLARLNPAYEDVRGLFLAHTDARVDYILAGCVLALLPAFHPVVLRFLRRCGSGLGPLLLAFLLGITAALSRFDLHTPQAILIALLVVSTVDASSWLATILARPALVTLGKWSYSLYLWQQLFLAPSHFAWLQSPLALPFRCLAALAAAVFSYRFVERPMIRLGRRIVDAW